MRTTHFWVSAIIGLSALSVCHAGTPYSPSTDIETPMTPNNPPDMENPLSPAKPEQPQTPTTDTHKAGEQEEIFGTVTKVIFGAAFDANDVAFIETDKGQEISVMVLEGGRRMIVPGDSPVCAQNELARKTLNQLAVGDKVRVVGKWRSEQQIEVCSSPDWILERL